MAPRICVVIGNSKPEQETKKDAAISLLVTFTTGKYPGDACPDTFPIFAVHVPTNEASSQHYELWYFKTIEEFPREHFSKVDTFILTFSYLDSELGWAPLQQNVWPIISRHAPWAAVLIVMLEDDEGKVREGQPSYVYSCSARINRGVKEVFERALISKQAWSLGLQLNNSAARIDKFNRNIECKLPQCLAFFGDDLYVGTSRGLCIFLRTERYNEPQISAVNPKPPVTEVLFPGGISAMVFHGSTLFMIGGFMIGGSPNVLLELGANNEIIKSSKSSSLGSSISGITSFQQKLYVSSSSPAQINVFHPDGSMSVWPLLNFSGPNLSLAFFRDQLHVADQTRGVISCVSEQKCEDVVTGLVEPGAMACMGDELYFCQNSNLCKVDLNYENMAEVLLRLRSGAVAFRGGNCFITEKDAHAVYTISDKKSEKACYSTWQTFLDRPNRPPYAVTPFSSLYVYPHLDSFQNLAKFLAVDRNLVLVDASWSRCCDKNALYLAEALVANTTLETVLLNNCGLTDSSARPLAVAMGFNRKITKFDLTNIDQHLDAPEIPSNNKISPEVLSDLSLLTRMNDHSVLDISCGKATQQVPDSAWERLRNSPLRSLKFVCKVSTQAVVEALEWQLAFRLGLWGKSDSKVAATDPQGDFKLTVVTHRNGVITPTAAALPPGKRGSVLSQWLELFSATVGSHQKHNSSLRDKVFGKKSAAPLTHEFKELDVSPSRKALLKAVVEQDPELFAVNSRTRNHEGISYYESCNRTLRNIIDEVLLFCGIYRLISTMPEHQSDTCCILRAVDIKSDKTVVLKLMLNEDQFERELTQRRGLDDSRVLSVLDSSAQEERWAKDVARFLKVPYQYGLVLEAAQRNLMVVLLQERLNIFNIQTMFGELIKCVQHMHEANRVHADLKPLNMVRMNNGSWRLIDLDATVPFGSNIGVKTSTAYCPPELHELDQDGQFHLVPLQASPSFDLWSMGCVLYRALARKPLLEADDRDNLRGAREKGQLFNWGPSLLSSALAELSASLRSEAEEKKETESDHLRLAALDLVGFLLQSDPLSRPSSCAQVLEHAFLNKDGSWFMSPLHRAAWLNEAEGVMAAAVGDLSSTKHSVAKTPIHLAAEEGCSEALEALLSRGASLIVMDAQGNNAIQSVLNLLGSAKHNDRLTSRLLPICRRLCEVSDLSLSDGSELRKTTLELGRSCRNRRVREMFENEIVELQLLGALKFRPPRSFAVADFNKVWNSGSTQLQASLKDAVMLLLSEWGLQRYVGADWTDPRSWKAWHEQSVLKHNYVCSLILPLACWQVHSNFEALKHLAKTKAHAGLGDMYVIRDKLLEIAPAIKETKTFGSAPAIQMNVAQSLLECAGGDHAKKRAIDEKVLVPLVQLAADGLHARFKERLLACLSSPPELSEIHATETLSPDWSRWVAVAPVKGMARVISKMGENEAETEAKRAHYVWPYVSSLGDTLRAMVVCRDAVTIHDTWNRLNDEFCVEEEGRLKNNFRDAGFGVKELPPDMLMNTVLREPSFLPLVIEIQVHHVEILALKEFEQHLFYEITRASSPLDFQPLP